MAEFDLLSVAAGGMQAQRALLDVAARNVAAAQASTPQHPFPRLIAQLAVAPAAERDPFDPAFADDEPADDAPAVRTVPGAEGADALTEMIAVLDAQRAYEANASVFDVGKRLAERTLDVGRT